MTPYDGKFEPKPECPRCWGLGRILAKNFRWFKCRNCHGTGLLDGDQT